MKILLLAVLLGLVLSVDCRRRKPQRGGKHGLKKTKGKYNNDLSCRLFADRVNTFLNTLSKQNLRVFSKSLPTNKRSF